jgi:hypothetical protein
MKREATYETADINRSVSYRQYRQLTTLASGSHLVAQTQCLFSAEVVALL